MFPGFRERSRGGARRSARGGYALVITLVFLLVALLIFAGIFSWTSSNARVTVQNNQYNMSENAAEAGVEMVISHIDRDFINLRITNSAGYTGLPATIDQSTWPVQYTYSNTNGVTNVVSVALGPVSSNTVPLSSQYSGLQAYSCRWMSMPRHADWPAADGPRTVHESMQLALIPMFQFAIFYNVNLEIDPGQTMYISGPVFCNQNIWKAPPFAPTLIRLRRWAPMRPRPVILLPPVTLAPARPFSAWPASRRTMPMRCHAHRHQ